MWGNWLTNTIVKPEFGMYDPRMSEKLKKSATNKINFVKDIKR